MLLDIFPTHQPPGSSHSSYLAPNVTGVQAETLSSPTSPVTSPLMSSGHFSRHLFAPGHVAHIFCFILFSFSRGSIECVTWKILFIDYFLQTKFYHSICICLIERLFLSRSFSLLPFLNLYYGDFNFITLKSSSGTFLGSLTHYEHFFFIPAKLTHSRVYNLFYI